jgi:hypothetical protein
MSDRDSRYLVATGESKPSNVEADTRTRGVAMSTAISDLHTLLASMSPILDNRDESAK